MPPAPPVIDDRPLSADRVPTLTEVVELDLPSSPSAVDERAQAAPEPGEGSAADPALAPPADAVAADSDPDAADGLADEAAAEPGRLSGTRAAPDTPRPCVAAEDESRESRAVLRTGSPLACPAAVRGHQAH